VGFSFKYWRREWYLNPRYLAVRLVSSQAINIFAPIIGQTQSETGCAFERAVASIEAWILEHAGVTFDAKAEPGKLRVVNG
jgi:hypothetical protein